MKNRKNIFLIAIILLSFIIVISLFIVHSNKKNNNNNNDNNVKSDFIDISLEGATGIINNRIEITEDKNFNGIVLKNINLSAYNDPNLSEHKVCVFEADLFNYSNNVIQNINKKIIFKDEIGKEIASSNIYIEYLEREKSTFIHIQTFDDIINAYSFEVVDVEE